MHYKIIKDKSIIKPADKGSAIVIWDREFFYFLF